MFFCHQGLKFILLHGMTFDINFKSEKSSLVFKSLVVDERNRLHCPTKYQTIMNISRSENIQDNFKTDNAAVFMFRYVDC